MRSPLFYLKDITLSFGIKPLFENLDLNLYPQDRVCLVGKNGEGKSSLLKLIAGEYDVDCGQRWYLPGAKVGYLPQQAEVKQDMTVHDYVVRGLQNVQEADFKYIVDMVINPLQLDPNAMLSQLSGGLLRRAFLAQTLISAPDILLLDEPTNHLDIATIEWLEEYVNAYRGAIICISHDRRFLKNISTKTFWLDRGSVRTNGKGYEDFERWSIDVLEMEQRELVKLEKKLDEEEVWRQQGVTARRKRNQKRLHDLHALRDRMQKERASAKLLLNQIKLDPLSPVASSKMVCEFDAVSKAYGNKKLISNLSLRIMKGDKIGVVGVNGAGKTTFLKLLTGEEEQDEGRIRVGKTVQITYCDQNRNDLDPEETLWRTLAPGGDYIDVGGNAMHVVSYLKNFLFDPKQARERVGILSGGQANRLLLAKNLASPGSLLILDEPTNDLDMDTLDMIQEILSDYNGTLIVVSHDRDFLDSIVTKTIYFAGNGVVEEFVGSYQSPKKSPIQNAAKKKKNILEPKERISTPKKLTYATQRELDMMPDKIASLEERIDEIEALLMDVNLYQNARAEFDKLSKELVEKKAELSKSWDRWAELG